MGAIFAVPLAKASTIAELPGVKVALVPRDGKPLDQLERLGELSIMIGSERDGLPRNLIDQADHVAHIPIHSDSLNAAMAATVALYELALRMDRR
jgi:TrmH family RNA methyltransferase